MSKRDLEKKLEDLFSGGGGEPEGMSETPAPRPKSTVTPETAPVSTEVDAPLEPDVSVEAEPQLEAEPESTSEPESTVQTPAPVDIAREFIERLPDGYYEVDLAGNFRRVNSALCRIVGYAREELLGRSYRVLRDDENTDRVFDAFQRVFRNGQPVQSLTYAITRKDGVARTVETSIALLRDAQDQPRGFCGITREVTVPPLAESNRDDPDAADFTRTTDGREDLLADLERRTVQLQTAAEVSRVASSLLDPQELIRQSVNLIRDRFELYYVGMFLVDEQGEWTGEPGRWAVLRAGTGDAGQSMISRGHKLAVNEASLIGWCITNRRARIALDTGDHAVQFDNPFLPGTRSELVLPLIARDKMLGAMSVQSEEQAAFGQADVAVLQTMADQIATAIVNAGLFGESQTALFETEHQARRLSMLNKLSQQLTRVADANEAYRITAGALKDIFVAERASIALLDDSGEQVEIFTLQDGQSLTPSDERVSLEGTAIGRAMREGRVLITPASRARHYQDTRRLSEQGLLSTMIAPLTVGGRTLGTLNVVDHSPSTYTTRDEALMLQVVSMLSSALENRRLFQQTQHTLRDLEVRAVQLQTAAEVSRSASSLLDVQELLVQTVNLIRDRFELYYVGLFLVDEPGEWAVLRAGTGDAGRAMIKREHRLAINEKSMIGWCISNKQPRVALDVGEDAVRFDNPFVPETRSELALPLIVRGEVVGALSVQSSVEAAFSESDVSVLQTMADQVATAIANARLFERTQAALAETRALSEVSQSLTAAAGTLDGVLAAVVDAMQSNGLAADLDHAALYSLDLDLMGLPEVATFIAWWGVDFKEPSLLFETRQSLRDNALTELWVKDPAHPLLVSDVNTDERVDEKTRAIYRPEETCALVMMPLRTAGRWLGLLTFGWIVPHTFSELEQRIFHALMGPFATVFDNHRLFDRLELQLTDLAKVQKATSELTQALTQSEVVEMLLPEVLDAVQADTVTAFTVEDEHLVRIAVYPQDEDRDPGIGQRVSLANYPLTREVIESGQAVAVTADDSRLQAHARESFKAAGITAHASVPLMGREGVRGVLSVNLRQPDRNFNFDELSLLQMLAYQATIALERVSLTGQTQEALAETQALYDVSLTLSGGLAGYDAMLRKLVRSLERNNVAAGITNASLATFEVDAEGLPEVATMVGWAAFNGSQNGIPVGTRLPSKGNPLIDLWIRDPANPTVIGNVFTDERLDDSVRQMFEQTGDKASLFLPLKVGDSWVGVLGLGWAEPHEFSERDVRIFRALMGQLAALVEGQRLGGRVRLLAAIVENHTDFIGVGDLEGNVLYINPAGLRMMSLSRDHNVSEMNARNFYPAHDADLLVREGIPVAREQGSWSAEVNLVRNDGELIPVDETVGIHYDASGEPVSFSVTMRDISERRRAEREREQLLSDLEQRTVQLRTAAEVARAASSELDLDGLMGQTVNLIRDRFNLYYVGLFLIDEARERVVLRAGTGEAGRAMIARGHALSVDDQSMIGWSISNRQARIALDVGEEAVRFNNPYLPDTRSELALPLISRGEVLGALSAQSTLETAFSESDVAVLQIMADQVANAIANARFFNQTQEALAESNLLFTTSKRLVETRDVEELLEAETEFARELGARSAQMFYVDIDAQGQPESVDLMAVWNAGKDSQPMSMPRDDELVFNRMALALPDRPLILSDVQNDEDMDADLRDVFVEANIGALAYLPLTIQGRWVGLISFYWTDPYEFTPRDERIFTALAQQAAPVVDAVRAVQQTQQALAETELVYTSSRRLIRATNLDEILSSVSAYARMAGANAGQLLTVERDEEGVPQWSELAAAWQLEGEEPTLGQRYPLSDFPLLDLVQAHPEQPLVFEDIATSEMIAPAMRELLSQFASHGLALLPLTVQERSIGVITLSWKEPHQFTERDERIFAALAQQAAPVVDATTASQRIQQALNVTQKLAVQLRTAADVSRAASSELDQGDLMTQTVNLIRDRFELYYVGLFLVDEQGEWTGEPGRWAVLRAGTGEAGRAMLERGHKLAVDDTSMIGWSVAHEQARIALDVGEDAVRFNNPFLPKTRSELALPLIARGTVLGALSVQSVREAAFADTDIAVLQTMVDQVATALANARLFNQTQRALFETEEQARRLALLNETSSDLSRALDVNEVYQIVGRNIGRTVAAERVSLALLDDTGKYLDMSVLVGDQTAIPTGTRMPVQGTALGRALNEKGMTLLDDLQTVNLIDTRQLAEHGFRSAIYAPLMVSRRLIGTLNLFSRRPNAFTARDEQIMLQVVAMLASAIENRRLFVQIEEALLEAQVLFEASQALTSAAGTLDAVLAAMVDALQANNVAANLDNAALYAIDPGADGQPEWATFIGWWGVDYKEPTMLFDARTSLRESSVTEMWVNDPGNPLFFGDIQNDPRLDEDARAAFLQEGIHSAAFLPLRTAGRWLGILHLNWIEVHEINDLERRVFRALMNPFATVFDNHRLFDRLELQLADLAKIQKVTSDLTEAVGYQEVLDILLPQTADAVQADSVSMLTIEDDHARCVSAYPDDQQGLFTIGERQRVSDHALLREVIESGQPVLHMGEDPHLDRGLREAFERVSITALASIPLVSREGLQGIMVVSLSQPGRNFSISELSILQTLADQATIAIERVQLFDETRRTARRQTLINQITNKMRAAVNVEEVLHIATDELRRATQSARAVAELSLSGHVEDGSTNGSNGSDSREE